MAGELILGRYRVISQAGAGGFATVQLAWDTRIQRRVAIKCLRLDGRAAAAAAGRDSISMYDAAQIPGLEEARTAAMLQDPNIVGILDFEIRDGLAYLIMEYVDGITLSRLMDDYGEHINLDVIAAVFAGISHALEVAHGNQVLHLDIKPDNVMINHQGQIKVTDFGLAKLSSASGYSKASGGTIGYMPLEQMRLQTLDARCDEWALASITYEMIAGTNPFNAEDLDKAQRAIENAELVLPSLCMPGLDEEADDVLFYALDPDREERYDSVQDFAEELRPFLGSVKRGTRQLAQLVGNAVDDADHSDLESEMPAVAGITEHLNKLGGFDKSGSKRPSRTMIIRLWSLLNCGLLGFVGCTNIAWLASAPPFTALLLIALLCLVSLFIPHAAAVLAMLFLSAAFLSQGAYVCGALLAVLGIVWWISVGRQSVQVPLSMLSASTFGSFGCAGVAPLTCGVGLGARGALINVLASSVLASTMASLGSLKITGWNAVSVLPRLALNASSPAQFVLTDLCDQQLLTMASSPDFLIAVVSWIVAAVLCGILSKDGGIVRRILGLVAAACVLVAGLIGQAFVQSAGASYMPSQSAITMLVVSFAISLVFVFVTAPDSLKRR